MFSVRTFLHRIYFGVCTSSENYGRSSTCSSKAKTSCRLVGLVLFVYMGVMHRKGQSAKSDNTQQNDCKDRLYSLSEELSRSFQLPVKSFVRRENARCSCPREEHSEIVSLVFV